MTLGKLLQLGREELEGSQVPEADLNAWYLLQACLSTPENPVGRNDFFLRKDEGAHVDVQNRFFSCLEKRKQRIPLEYITGQTEFMGFLFHVNEHVLIPRQDTETLVEYAVSKCQNKRVLDLCTGSGCIGLSIGMLAKPSDLLLSDISEEALKVARGNQQWFQSRGMWHSESEVEFVCSDLFEKIEGTFDVIVSNPPYIESRVIPELMPEVKQFEPMAALDGGEDGLEFYRKITKESQNHLLSGGILCYEIGYNQGESVSSLMNEYGFAQVQVLKDLAGMNRVVSGVFEK